MPQVVWLRKKANLIIGPARLLALLTVLATVFTGVQTFLFLGGSDIDWHNTNLSDNALEY